MKRFDHELPKPRRQRGQTVSGRNTYVRQQQERNRLLLLRRTRNLYLVLLTFTIIAPVMLWLTHESRPGHWWDPIFLYFITACFIGLGIESLKMLYYAMIRKRLP